MAGEPKNQPPFTNPVDTSGIGAAATKTLTTPGITTVRSSDDLMGAAISQVDQEIASQVNPLQGQYDQLDTSEVRARDNLNSMFGNIMPYVSGAAANVKGAYDEAEAKQGDIMAAATQRLNQLKQSRAQEAQALAQQMGGPVSIGEFTAGMDDASTSLANLGAGQQLHTLQYGLADVGEANAFAGRVMPLVQTEQQAKARQYFEDQKKTIQDQITSIKGQRGSKITSAYNDALVKEREYALQKTQQHLDAIKAQHDWQATKRTLKNDDKRLGMSDRQFRLQEAGVTGKYGGKATLQAKSLTTRDKQFAQQMGLSNKEFQLRRDSLAAATKVNQQRLAAANRNTAAQYLDAAVNPQPGKTVTVTRALPVPRTAAMTGKVKDAYKDPSSPTGFSRLAKVVQTPVTAPITNPTALTDYLVAHNVPKPIAIRMVKARLQVPNWVYGEGDPNAPTGWGGRSQPGGIQRPG